MKILFEHANYFKYTKDQEYGIKYDNCLIARVCFEKGDGSKLNLIKGELKKIYLKLKPENLILFPFSHLSNNLLAMDIAKVLFVQLGEDLNSEGVNVISMPFGTNKGYQLCIKEHKLNNMFRHF